MRVRTYVRMHSTNEKGAIAELEIAAAAIKLGVSVYKPLSEHSRADLMFEIGDGLWRVQCKWGRLSPSRDTARITVGGCSCSPHGYVRTTDSEHEVDLFAIYCGELDRSFLLPVSAVAGKHELWLRLTPARNSQRSCITLADEFDFPGAVAQLGERVTGSHEVRGSSPLSSTLSDTTPVVIGSNIFRDKLGYWMDRVAAGEEVLTRHGKPRIRLSSAA
jgi:hypothetical protein